MTEADAMCALCYRWSLPGLGHAFEAMRSIPVSTSAGIEWFHGSSEVRRFATPFVQHQGPEDEVSRRCETGFG